MFLRNAQVEISIIGNRSKQNILSTTKITQHRERERGGGEYKEEKHNVFNELLRTAGKFVSTVFEAQSC
jgi:hypothetical protein